MTTTAQHCPIPVSARVFTVTGAGSGIGAATVRLLAQNGAAAIHACDLNPAGLATLAAQVAEINPLTGLSTREVDVSDPAAVQSWIRSVAASSGGVIHGAANVAGVPQPAFSSASHTAAEEKYAPAILEQTDDDWRRVFGVNTDGVMRCTREQVRVMSAMPPGSNPSIVNVSSMASLLHGPSAFAYGASKAACAHFTTCVAKDVYPCGIRANTVSPGNTFTGMTKAFFGHLSREETEDRLRRAGVGAKMLEAEDVARSIVWLLSEASLDVNGVNLPVGEGIP